MRLHRIVIAVAMLAFLLVLKGQAADLLKKYKNVRQLTSSDVLAAMQTQTGYDPTATTNVARFQASVLLELARTAMKEDSARTPLFIGYAEWFEAFLIRNGISTDEAPQFARLSFQHEQDQLVEYDAERIVKNVDAGPLPVLAVTVLISWSENQLSVSKYTFADTLATPKLQVTNHSLITYRLLDFGDMIMYDDIRGLTGRPTSGVLGLLFDLIGEGRVVQSRIAVSRDGLQINRAKAKKGLFGVTRTLTIRPDGHTSKNIPDERADLGAIEETLKKEIALSYYPMTIDLK